jgi:protein TonB
MAAQSPAAMIQASETPPLPAPAVMAAPVKESGKESSSQAAAAPAVSPPAPAPAPVMLPRSDADYLNNPAPPYPSASRRQGEQGKVTIRCFVSVAGAVERAELRSSSGFERLDAAALEAVKNWRFKPGTRGGAAQAMWVNVPVVFSLD